MNKNFSLQYVSDLSNPFSSVPKHWLIYTYTGHGLLMQQETFEGAVSNQGQKCLYYIGICKYDVLSR